MIAKSRSPSTTSGAAQSAGRVEARAALPGGRLPAAERRRRQQAASGGFCRAELLGRHDDSGAGKN